MINLASEYGYDIIIKPHPKIMEFIDLFDTNDYVYVDKESTYQQLFNNSSLLITDYSSVAFDFAYIKKPVLYYQYSDDYHFEETFFDYETMGFGEVINDIDKLVDTISEYLKNDCKMKKFKDRDNCKRVYNEIKKL